MNIKELAEHAGLQPYYKDQERQIERFAELIRADERDKCAQEYLQDCSDAIDAARLEVRESCAKICDAECNKEDSMKIISTYESGCYMMAEFLANEIRSRK